MANVTISDLPATTTLTAASLVAVVQSGVTKQTPASAFVSEALSFTPAGTGGTPQTVQAKLRKFLTTGDNTTTAQEVTQATANYSGSFVAPTANIFRLRDRVFIGNATQFGGTTLSLPDSGTSWLTTAANGPTFLPTNAQLAVMCDAGQYAIFGGSRASDGTGSTIGVAGAVLNDKASADAWGIYSDLDASTTSNQTIGIEIAAKNRRNANTTFTPNAQVGGVFGVWLAGGGDSAYGSAPAFPSTAGISFIKNASTWNTGIVFMVDSLTSGQAIAFSSQGTGGAHFQGWYDSSGNEVFTFKSSATGATAWAQVNDNNGFSWLKATKTLFQVNGAAAAVNGFLVFAGAAGTSPQFVAQGDTADLDVHLVPKGAGLVRFGTLSGLGAEVLSGYITVKDAAGNSRKIGVIA